MNRFDANNECAMVRRTHTGVFHVSVPEGRCSDARQNLSYIIGAFGFLIERNEEVTFSQFAQRIGKVYDAAEPRTAAVIAALEGPQESSFCS